MVKFKLILYTFYLLLLLFLFFSKGGNYQRHFSPFTFQGGLNVIPLKNKIQFFTYKGKYHYNDWFYFIREIVGNLLILFPLPFILILGEGMSNMKKVLLLSFSVSFAVESIQFILGIGQADVDDLILNTVGAAIATVLAFSIRNVRLKMHHHPSIGRPVFKWG